MDSVKDWALPLAEIVKAIFWPLVVGLSLCYFRKEIRLLLQQLKCLKVPGGTEAAFEKSKDALATQQKPRTEETVTAIRSYSTNIEYEKEKAEFSASPTVRAISQHIRQNVAKSSYTPDQMIEVGTLALAKSLMISDFWRIYSFIFGSQLALLQLVNTQPISEVNLDAYYRISVQARYPDAFQNKDTNAYMEFLRTNGLVAPTSDAKGTAFSITDKGKEFLVWCINNQLSFSKPF